MEDENEFDIKTNGDGEILRSPNISQSKSICQMGCIFVDHRIGRRCIQHIVCGMFESGDAVSDRKPMDDPVITTGWYCYCIFVPYFSL